MPSNSSSRKERYGVKDDYHRIIVNENNYIFKNAFKRALNVIPNNFNSYDSELMNLECKFCNTKHFGFEIIRPDRTVFTSYCHK